MGPKKINYKRLDEFIHEFIPAGFKKNTIPFEFDSLDDDRREYYRDLEEAASELCERNKIKVNVFYNSIGTLGGGNHFIEIGLADKPDENGEYNRWLSIHSGSRNPGLTVANHYQSLARKYWRETKRNSVNNKLREYQTNLPKTLTKKERKKMADAFLETISRGASPPKAAEFLPLSLGGLDYLHDMKLMQKYAELNREVMLTKIMNFLNRFGCQVVRSVHNYINF